MNHLRQPNIVFVFADEWRQQATGYAGDPNCRTPNLDALAGESVNVSRAVAGLPVCCPYRASLLTGQYPLTHGVFINDVELDPASHTLAREFSAAGYRTAYVGKWHVYGSPDGRCGRRKARVPRTHQMGFDDWWGFECCHDYWNSPYYHNDQPEEHLWEGYDLLAQSDHAGRYIRDHADDDQPFLLMVSWGPPHFPLHTAPEEYRRLYEDLPIRLRENVPEDYRGRAEEDLRGYYAHIAALDEGLGRLLEAIDASGRAEDTLLIVTSDHGEMAWSHGLNHKLVPFDESIRVPFLARWPAGLGPSARECPVPLDAPDIFPTLLGLIGRNAPASVEGRDWSPVLRGQQEPAGDEAALLLAPAASTTLLRDGIEPYRGLRTRDITYVRTRSGPWLLLDNRTDPFQMHNLVGDPDHAELLGEMDAALQKRLAETGDEFLPGREYLQRAGLTHYREVNEDQRRQWTYPWQQ